MVPYLEQNRKWQTQLAKLVRKGKRLRRMRRLLVNIRNQTYLLDTDGGDVSEDEVAGNDSTDAPGAQNTDNTSSSSSGGFSSVTEDESDWNMEKIVPLVANVPSTGVRRHISGP